MDLKKLEKLMQLMREHGMNEVEIEDKDKGTCVKVVASAATTVAAAAPSMPIQAAAPSAVAAPSAASTSATEAAAPARGVPIKSPFVGTFYEASSPDAEAYVKVGQRVNKGDVLCIIEAMKLMNEIESEQSGTIIEIRAKNGEPVQFDQELFVIE